MFGVAAMLPVLAAASLYCAWVIRRLAVSYARATTARAVDVAPDLAPESPRPGLRVLHDAPYLRNLAGLVLLGTLAAALLDYLFKAQAVAAFGRGEGLIRFFALYYSATSLITFALQTSSARFSLERLGLAATTGTPSIAVLAGGIAGLVAPGLVSLVAARGAETDFPRGACSAPPTSCSTRRCHRPNAAPRSRSSTSASIASATRWAAASFSWC